MTGDELGKVLVAAMVALLFASLGCSTECERAAAKACSGKKFSYHPDGSKWVERTWTERDICEGNFVRSCVYQKQKR